MNERLNVCVFAGSSMGSRPSYQRAAIKLGASLAQRQLGMVYGGASVGLMGAAADAALANGGTVIGVIPEALARKEIAHPGLTELKVVSTMHARKAEMAALADAFVVLPGGIGSLEETFEMMTWSQLGIHRKAIGLLNVDGFYDGLLSFVDHLAAEAFVKSTHRNILLADVDPAALLDRVMAAEIPSEPKWIDP